ncbi:hypothetical protein BHS06_34710 [Myxococcus xanthus]|nr:hypothetical protein BHS06_34710 [Myxococcus xanthus]
MSSVPLAREDGAQLGGCGVWGGEGLVDEGFQGPGAEMGEAFLGIGRLRNPAYVGEGQQRLDALVHLDSFSLQCALLFPER